ncbi:patatin-like phospholipase family protein [Rhodoplanes sp. SY1]|uniref:patatin-like phospholipase family protein n=1 Tax=Rhodoplanes sp. SY1 TaxID=3166646 RepID=UPI0038B4A5C2
MRSWSPTCRVFRIIPFGLALSLGIGVAVAMPPVAADAAPRQKLVCPKTLVQPGAFADDAEHARYAACLRRAEARKARLAKTKQQAAPAGTAAAATGAAATATAGREATGKTQPSGRDFKAADLSLATIPGIPGARFWGDSEGDYLRVLGGAGDAWLALSAGGEDSGFGAGLFTGLSASGRRTDYAVVTGVSSGALLAPFIFLGSARDAEMRDNFMALNAAEVFEDQRTRESLLDTWPLRKFLERHITRELIDAVAAEHARGRRLIVLTANLDTARPVAWNMGAIAAAGTEASRKLFRDVLVASSAIPGLFPPMMIETEANGRKIQEMHVDGGLASTLYVAPDSMLLAGAAKLPMKRMTLVINGKLRPEFDVTDRSLVGVLGRSLSVGVKRGSRTTALLAAAAARRAGIGFEIAYVDQGFDHPSRGMFDPAYMKALFESGLAQGKSATPFRAELPGTGSADAAAGGPDRPATAPAGGPTDGSAAQATPPTGGATAQ